MSLPESALAPAGVQAERIASLFWSYFAVSAVVFVLVVAAFVAATARREDPRVPERTEIPHDAAPLRPRTRAVTAASIATALTLVVLLVLSIVASKALASLKPAGGVRVDVVGHKWWWEVRYSAQTAGIAFTTAYEIHVPVGKPVELHLTSADVIHSFWVPALDGKRDLIPGKPGELVLQADRPGRYEGVCAEFCGTQHANMRFTVVAEPEPEFRAWLAAQLTPAVAPDDDLKKRGQQVFLEGRCVTCHSIAGTMAMGSVGPDLTHVASRRSIAGTLGMSPGHLAGWTADPQSVKPGVQMPSNPLPPEDVQALLAYLGSLR